MPIIKDKMRKVAGIILHRLMQMDAFAITFRHDFGIDPCRKPECMRDFVRSLVSANVSWVEWCEHHLNQMIAHRRVPEMIDEAAMMVDVENKAIGSVVGPKALGKDMEVAGPKIWAELHSNALSWDGSDQSRMMILGAVGLKLPCGQCKMGWQQINKDLPPPSTNASDLFEWTVEAHNRVNDKLGKPRITLDEALAIYSFAS